MISIQWAKFEPKSIVSFISGEFTLSVYFLLEFASSVAMYRQAKRIPDTMRKREKIIIEVYGEEKKLFKRP